MAPKKAARFIEPMLLLRTDALPNDASDWEYQLKLDGYRAIAFKTRGRVPFGRATTMTSASAIRPSSRASRSYLMRP
jgi:hypothetical protein